MDAPNLRFRVGLFVLGMLALLGLLAVVFGRLPSYLKRHDEYAIVFRDAPGVSQGTPVRRSGVRIGEVETVTLDDNRGVVRVGVAIEKGHTVRGNDRPVLARSVLGGDVAIDLVPQEGPGGNVVVEPGSEITGQEPTDVGRLLSQTSQLVPSTQEALDRIRRSMERLERMAPLMEETAREYRDLARETRRVLPELRRTNDEALVTARNWGRLGERLDVLLQTNQDKLVRALDNFNDTVVRVGNTFNPENQRNLAATLKNVRAGTENLDAISRNADALLKDSRQTLQRLNGTLGRTDEVMSNLQQATRPAAERSPRIMQNLDESADKLNRTLTDTRDLMRGLNAGDGTLRRLAVDPSLYNNLNDAACMLTRILPRVDRILHDLQVFADKIARHPESLGLGGVVNPSSGLKEAAPGASGGWMHR